MDTKTIDNLDILLPFIQPTSGDDFYYLQILQRKKENPELGRNSRVIKNYYIKDQEELLKKYSEIKQLCEIFNARASLRLNKRSFEKVAFKALINYAENMQQRDFLHIPHGYDRAVGLGHNEPKGNAKWILDIDDNPSQELLNEMMKVIDFSRPEKEGSKILAIVPSKTGVHIITSPFDSRMFDATFPGIDKHKDNPTNLYIP